MSGLSTAPGAVLAGTRPSEPAATASGLGLVAGCGAGRHAGCIAQGGCGNVIKDALEIIEEDGIRCALEDKSKLQQYLLVALLYGMTVRGRWIDHRGMGQRGNLPANMD